MQSLIRPKQLSHTKHVCAPCLRRQQEQHRRFTTKRIKIPQPRPFVPDVQTFLTLIGRGLSAQASKFQSWNSLFTLTSEELKEMGIEPARDRRYLLRWIENFRNGKLGPGGDFKYVKDGTAELRVCEIPAKNKSVTGFVSATQTPGMTKLVLNVPQGSKTYHLGPGQTTGDLKKPSHYSLKSGRIITGPWATPVKGANGSVVTVKVQEGMWEDKLGKKVFGGERRRAEVLHKLGVEEHRKAIGATR